MDSVGQWIVWGRFFIELSMEFKQYIPAKRSKTFSSSMAKRFLLSISIVSDGVGQGSRGRHNENRNCGQDMAAMIAMTRAARAARALSFDFFFPLAKSKATALQPSCSEILKGKLQELQELQVVRYLGRPAGSHDASCLALLKNMCHDHSQNLIIWV